MLAANRRGSSLAANVCIVGVKAQPRSQSFSLLNPTYPIQKGKALGTKQAKAKNGYLIKRQLYVSHKESN